MPRHFTTNECRIRLKTIFCGTIIIFYLSRYILLSKEMNTSITRLIVLFVGISLLSLSCQKVPSLTLTSANSIDFSADGGKETISFTTNSNWRVSSSDSWVTVSPSSGSESADIVTVTISCSVNTTYDERKSTVSIATDDLSQSVTIRQSANVGIVVPTKLYNLQSSAKIIEVEVQSNVDYSVESSVDWITVTGTKGLSSRSLLFNIDENQTYDSREGHITLKPINTDLAEEVITVKQAQKDALNVEITSYEMPYGGGEIEVKVEANVTYDVTPNSSWIHYVQTKALSNSIICLRIDENTTYDTREGIVDIIQQGGSQRHTITVKQQQAPGLLVSPNNFNLTYEAQTVALEVKNNVSFNILIPDEAKDWISIQSNTQTKAMVDDRVVLAIALNGTSSKREACITIKQNDGSLNKVVLIKQAFFEGINVTQSTFQLNREAQTIEFSVFSSDEYDIVNTSWCKIISQTKVSPIETSFIYQVYENIDTQSRKATITFKQKTGGKTATVSITQGPTYVISLFGAFYGIVSCFEQQITFALSTNGRPLTYSCDKDWIRFITEGEDLLYPRPVFAINANTSREDRDAIISIKTANGGATLDLNIKQKGVRDVPEGAVELGLSVLWADCNVGASVPEGFGGYYSWGEVEEKSVYSWKTYKWNKSTSLINQEMSKYNNSDGLVILERNDDVASVKMGDKWRSPTSYELRELWEKCYWSKTVLNGVQVYEGRSPITGNIIIIPLAGGKIDDKINWVGNDYALWSSSVRAEYGYTDARFLTNSIGVYSRQRYVGFTVRAVCE